MPPPSNLYAVGGQNLKSVEVLNGTRWSPGPDLTTIRAGAGLASHNGQLYAVGGDKSGVILNSVEVLTGTSWVTGPSLITARRYLGLA